MLFLVAFVFLLLGNRFLCLIFSYSFLAVFEAFRREISYFAYVDITVSDCKNSQGRNTFDIQLFHYILTMGHDGGDTDVQPVGYLFVDKPLRDESHDFYFTVG